MSKLPIHKQIYCDFFGLEPGDWIECEVTGGTAVEIHHIFNKQMGGKQFFHYEGVRYDIDAIENLIAVAREPHDDAHDELYTKEQLWSLHAKRMRNYLLSKEG